jgi:hypothetical protein
MRFDLSGLSEDDECVQATLYLYHSYSAEGGDEITATAYSVSEANGDWIEGVGNIAIALEGEPCWNAKEADGEEGVQTAWAGSAGMASSGTDYEATALGSTQIDPGDAIGTEYQIELSPTRIQGWLGATNTNYGIVVFNTNGNGGPHLGSAEHTTTGYRPKLVVRYVEAESDEITGTLSSTLGTLTLSGAGKVAIDGELSSTLAAVTLSSSATLGINGSLTATLGALTVSASAQLGINASLDVTLGALTLEAAGEGEATPITGALDSTLGALTLASTAQLSINGAVNSTLGTLTLSSSATLGINASLNKTLGELTIASTGTLGINGALSQTLGALTLQSSGQLSINGALNSTLATLTLDATAELTEASVPGYVTLSTAQLYMMILNSATLNTVTLSDATLNSTQLMDMLQSTVQIQQAQLYTVEVTDG